MRNQKLPKKYIQILKQNKKILRLIKNVVYQRDYYSKNRGARLKASFKLAKERQEILALKRSLQRVYGSQIIVPKMVDNKKRPYFARLTQGEYSILLRLLKVCKYKRGLLNGY